ncbi:arylsulfatase B-like [Asterias rubens]|uniref:arylsulfatase B-like n=1 Tax=Asterias rubens TaxID=7604 RepID=UPI0014557075|nr:arylsulfatase B-like [Asterias rubens]
MDGLADQGVKLRNYYVQPICTPTRTQLMTGRYQIHTGMQHSIIWPLMPSCLPLDEVTVAQKLKEAGYSTHLVGKWHLGLYKRACWPTRRGFDTFFGILLGSGGHLSHKRGEDLDFREQEELARNYTGIYSTHLYAERAQRIIRQHDQNKPFFLFLSFQAVHEPLEVPESYIKPYWRIKNMDRRKYAGMTTCMDEAIGNVTRTLEEKGIRDNTVIIFSTDNGGKVGKGANNWPLRGEKATLWEGGIHGIGFVNSPLLHPSVLRTSNYEMIHVSDWFPTMVEGLAGGSLNGTRPLDGFNMWDTISKGQKSPRTEILHNIDRILSVPVNRTSRMEPHNYTFNSNMRAAIRVGDWKLITGLPGPGDWHPTPDSGIPKKSSIHRNGQNIWLFNIRDDPNEYMDKSLERVDIVERLMERLQHHYTNSVPVFFPPNDPRGDPKRFGHVWTNWE